MQRVAAAAADFTASLSYLTAMLEEVEHRLIIPLGVTSVGIRDIRMHKCEAQTIAMLMRACIKPQVFDDVLQGFLLRRPAKVSENRSGFISWLEDHRMKPQKERNGSANQGTLASTSLSGRLCHHCKYTMPRWCL